MKHFICFYKTGIIGIMAISLMLLSSSCQYDYSSPQPGKLQIRLKTISNNIQFTELNNFIITYSVIQAVKNDGSRADIFEDLNAIDTKPLGINVLDFRARDSVLIIGETFVPPGDYSGVQFTITPKENLTLRGYQTVNVNPVGFESNVRIYLSNSYKVNEYNLTVVTIELNLDKSLVKDAFDYNFIPSFHISSIKNY
ncbi:MAG: DUF4382 domain-containing protein [Ignavibacteriales bacterium]|nr:DUF4382 domain-containing protein [Ignavibacteriales bacterium]